MKRLHDRWLIVLYGTFALVVVALCVFAREATTQTDGAERDISRQISTKTTETVKDTAESVESETDAQTCDESEVETDFGEWLTESEAETDGDAETESAVETESDTEAVAEQVAVEVAEYADYCPLPLVHDAVLCEVCETSGVPYPIALAIIWHESRFDPYAYNASSGCFGYCQLHPAYFDYCSPEDNIRAGIGWLGDLIREYGDLGAALTVYAIGHDNGSRVFAWEIIGIAREWGYEGCAN